jgi:hypothetical protein
MTAEELIETVEQAGGKLELNGDRVRYAMPPRAAHLVEVLRLQREEVRAILRQRHQQSQRPRSIPQALPDGLTLPDGVRVASWQPKEPPVAITRCSVVTDIPRFIEATLRQLQHAVSGDTPFLAGNWSARELIERLEQVGVKLELLQGDPRG